MMKVRQRCLTELRIAENVVTSDHHHAVTQVQQLQCYYLCLIQSGIVAVNGTDYATGVTTITIPVDPPAATAGPGRMILFEGSETVIVYA
jgi:hypothetical protein